MKIHFDDYGIAGVFPMFSLEMAVVPRAGERIQIHTSLLPPELFTLHEEIPEYGEIEVIEDLVSFDVSSVTYILKSDGHEIEIDVSPAR